MLQAQRFSCARVESRCAMLRFKTCAAVSAGGVRGLVSAASTEVLFSKVTDGKQRSKRSKKKRNSERTARETNGESGKGNDIRTSDIRTTPLPPPERDPAHLLYSRH